MSLYADIVFPLKIPPLTYKIPANSMPDLKGRIARAPLMGRLSYGLVVDVYDEPGNLVHKELKEIDSIHQHIATNRDLQFLKWLSSYYITPMGVALRGGFFEEIVKCSNESQGTSHWSKDNAPANSLPAVRRSPLFNDAVLVSDAVRRKEYKTFLYHAQSEPHEHAFLLETLGALGPDTRGIAVLVPEIGQIGRLEPALREIFGRRLCVIHSRLGKKKRAEAVQRLISGEADVVVGTRSAVLAPVRALSCIAVTGEHDPSYKGEEGLRYHARDVAVMKGFIEKRCVLLSSACPSVESFSNASAGKYAKINGSRSGHPEVDSQKNGQQPSKSGTPPSGNVAGDIGRPKIRLIEPKSGLKRGLSISEALLKEAKRLLSQEERLLFLVNRKGYSLLRCDDCGSIVQCRNCRISMGFRKKEGRVECRYCGQGEKAPETCDRCNGVRLSSFGAGTERVREELQDFLKTGAVVVEKGKGTPEGGISPLVVGTAYAMRNAAKEQFGAVAFLNFDMFLSQPDFRAYERAFQEVIRVSRMVKPGGSVFLQGSLGREGIMKFIRNYDFEGFYRSELSQRTALRYPPFAKLVLLNILAKSSSRELPDTIKAMLEEESAGIELLGPLEAPTSSKVYSQCIQVLMKSKDTRALHAAAQNVMSKLEKMKGLRVNVDVDPIKI